MWIITIMAILMGVLEIRYAYKSVEKDNKRIKRVFIIMGILTIMLGLFCLTKNQLYGI
jgi:uncharacterized membrane protein HdeD (DUF308 family)